MFMPRALSATTDAQNALVRYVPHPPPSSALCTFPQIYKLTPPPLPPSHSLKEIFKAPLMDETPLKIDPAQELALDVRDATFEWEESLAAKEAKEAQARKKKGKGPAVTPTTGAGKQENVDDSPPFQIRDVTMRVPRGSLVAVVGAVGSGKVSAALRY